MHIVAGDGWGGPVSTGLNADARPGPAVGLAPENDGPPRLTGWDFVEAAIAVAAFAILCVVILRTATFLPEPDDHAYQASVIAMTDGHFLSLSTAQVQALNRQLQASAAGVGPAGVAQWVQLANGRWISE